jgi:GAF domain-containing protein
MLLTSNSASARFKAILQTQGVREALKFLNRTSAHRFTALFRFEGGTLRNLHLIDRDDPTVERCPDLPVLESYCVYVRSTNRTFKIEDSWCDPRVEGHAKQRTVRSYCGVPLFTEDGELFGTICHFDYEAIPYADEEVYLLDAAAPLLVKAVLATEWRPPQLD